MNKIVTVITVVYNNVNAIEETVKSILSQNKDLFEFIVIDGKSTDGTLKLLNKYKDYIDIFISEPDYGIYDAMNKGINLASGEYIIFMNSGDTFYNSEVLDSFFNKNTNYKEYEVLFGDTNVVFEKYSSIVKGEYPSLHNAMSFNHQSVFVSTTLLKQNLFDTKYKICADKNFFAAIFKNGVNYLYLPCIVANISAFGFSNSNRVKTLLEVNRIMKAHSLPASNIKLKLIFAYILTFFEKIFGYKFINYLRKLKYE